MTGRRPWVVLPDLLSIRVFFDTGIVTALGDRLNDELGAVFLVPEVDTREWTSRLGEIPALYGPSLTAPTGDMRERVARRVDDWLDSQLGYYPLAIRLNYRHGFHLQRMQPGHPNWMLDSSREGWLPRTEAVERVMRSWFFSPRRHVPKRLLETMRNECAALVVSNVQPRSVMPYLAAARRLGIPVVAYVASWDHTVGKGVISPHCARYIVQNAVMEDDLRRYHGIAPDRVDVTGWPQTDVFHRTRPRADYDALLRSYSLDPGRPLVLVMGNTPTNAPYEGKLVERLVAWWDEQRARPLPAALPPAPARQGVARAVSTPRAATPESTSRSRATRISRTSPCCSSTATPSSQTRGRSCWTRS